MWEDFGKALTNVAFAGLGLAALAAEQVVKAGKVLAEKGEIYVEQGKRYGEVPTDVAVTDDERSKIGVIIRIEIRIEFVGFRTGTVVVGMREVKIAVTGRQCDHQSGTSDV